MKTVLCLMLAALGAALLLALPTGASSTGGPGVVMLDALVEQYEAVRFDHSMHASYFAKGCWDCHHQHMDYGSQPCDECHAIEAAEFKKSVTGSFLSCRSCHGEFQTAAPAMPGLKVAYHKQCFGCHRGMGNVGKSPEGCTEQCHARRESR